MDRRPSASYMSFVASTAKNIVDPRTTIVPDPKNPKAAKIVPVSK